MQDANIGIKETLELFDAVDATADAVTSICEDKKLTVMDLRFAVTPVRAAITAVKDADKVPDEMRNLDAIEIQQMIDRGERSIAKWQTAVAALKAMRDTQA